VGLGVKVRVGVCVAVAKKLEISATPQDIPASASTDAKRARLRKPLYFFMISSLSFKTTPSWLL